VQHTYWKQCEDRIHTTVVVDDFVYPGTSITKHRDELKDGQDRTGIPSLLPKMKPREVHRKIKTKPYETLTRSVLVRYRRCTHCRRLREKMLIPFQRVLRKIYGPMLVNGQLPNRHNHKIYKLFQKRVIYTSRTKSGT